MKSNSYVPTNISTSRDVTAKFVGPPGMSWRPHVPHTLPSSFDYNIYVIVIIICMKLIIINLMNSLGFGLTVKLKNSAHDLPAFAKSGLNLMNFPALQRLMQLRAGRGMKIFWALTPGVMGYSQIFAMVKVGVGLRRDLQPHCPLLLQLHTWHICKLSGFCTQLTKAVDFEMHRLHAMQEIGSLFLEGMLNWCSIWESPRRRWGTSGEQLLAIILEWFYFISCGVIASLAWSGCISLPLAFATLFHHIHSN